MEVDKFYIPGPLSRLYRRLEYYLKEELDKDVDSQYIKIYSKPPPLKILKWNIYNDRPDARNWLRLRDKLLKERNKGFMLGRKPSIVLQGEVYKCWASAMESWLEAILISSGILKISAMI